MADLMTFQSNTTTSTYLQKAPRVFLLQLDPETWIQKHAQNVFPPSSGLTSMDFACLFSVEPSHGGAYRSALNRNTEMRYRIGDFGVILCFTKLAHGVQIGRIGANTRCAYVLFR